MSVKYIMDDQGQPVETDLIGWARWMEGHSNRVARTDLPGDVEVSTVFLGLNHNFGRGKPILWETMIFGGEHDGYQERYTSREDALKGHEVACQIARGERGAHD